MNWSQEAFYASNIMIKTKKWAFKSQNSPNFSRNPTHYPVWMNFEWECRDTSAELGDIIQKVERDYSLLQNPTVVNRLSHQ